MPLNLNNLKTFAIETRRKLMRLVADKISFVLAAESSARRSSPESVQQLEKAISAHGRDHVIEETAYQWFNRFCALRFMDANHYTAVGVVSPADGASRPEILAEAVSGNFDLALDERKKQRVLALLAGEIPSNDRFNDAYRILFIASCNAWSDIMPFMFERIDDYTELLMPDDLLSANSILADLRAAITEDACADVEIIGWLYQFYVSEKKDEIFASLKKNKKISKEEIPAATELFTPHWIVQYLAENSLGRLWIENHPDSPLRDKMRYYIPAEPAGQTPRIDSPEDIRVCDPCCGSGHMLVYAFDLLYDIYEECGYDAISIPALILRKNLYGLEIDPRAAALASFALVMKARQKYRRFLSKANMIQPNICVLQDICIPKEDQKQYIDAVGHDIFTSAFFKTLSQFQKAETFGSLIVPVLQDSSLIRGMIDTKNIADNIFIHATHLDVLKLLEMADYLSPRYHVVITNPPYMGSKGMTPDLKDFAEDNYPDSKSDLFAMFIERCLALGMPNAFVAMVTMQSWMFLSSYEKLRIKLLDEDSILTLAHMANMVMGIAFGTSATIWKNKYTPQCCGKYFFVEYENIVDGKPVTFPPDNERNRLAAKRNSTDQNSFLFHVSAEDFKKLPGGPIAYWVNETISSLFKEGTLSDFFFSGGRFKTCNDELFLRFWWECNSSLSGWHFYNKGGDGRKYCGNENRVVRWTNTTQKLFSQNGGLGNKKTWDVAGITWATISTTIISFRLKRAPFFNSSSAPTVFASSSLSLFAVLGYLNSSVVKSLLNSFNPTASLIVADILRLPAKAPWFSESVAEMAHKNFNISKTDWDSFETSWAFQENPLIDANKRSDHSGMLYIVYGQLRATWEQQCETMRKFEVENNRVFIDIYGLQDELSPELPWDEITLTCNPWYRYGKTPELEPDGQHFSITGEINVGTIFGMQPTGIKVSTPNPIMKVTSFPFNQELENRLLQDTIKELISYAVGCMFGRYSLDRTGLAFAGGAWNPSLDTTFPPDADNVVPILDEDWFADDIVGRFQEFLKVAFGEENFHENLTFIEAALGKDIRSYFTKDFYADHVKLYQKRPIYWLFSSPTGAFSALIYLHRYRQDTVGTVLTYLRSHITKVNAHIQEQEEIIASAKASASMKSKAVRERLKMQHELQELEDYERDVLYPLSTERLVIDLDDGVKVNYPKFGKALRPVKGLDAKEE